MIKAAPIACAILSLAAQVAKITTAQADRWQWGVIALGWMLAAVIFLIVGILKSGNRP